MRAFFCALILFTAACGAPAQPQASPPGLEITEAWAAATPGGVDVSAGYLTIANPGAEDDQLLSVASTRSSRAEVHEMTMDGGVMRMRPIQALIVPAGEQVALAPGGRHLMFYGVSQPFIEGETIPVTLTFAHAGALEIALPVRRGVAHDGH